MFDLQVEGQHEFVAEGVVVHNCVWAITEVMVTSGKAKATAPSTRIA